MTEFRVSICPRLLVIMVVLGLVLAHCHAAPATAMDHGGFGGTFGEGLPEFYNNEPIQTPADLTGDVYSVPAINVSENPNLTPLSLTFVDREPHHYADIVFHNELSNVNNSHKQVNFIRPDGRVVTVYFDMGDGDAPDVFTVIPPPGYYALPPEISVEEGETGVIEIHEEALG